MKKKSLFILLVLCIGVFMPKNAFALQVYNNVNIDYRFFVDEDESAAGNLKFKLYDKSGTLNFDSQYDSNTKQYYFEYDENGFHKTLNSYNHKYYWNGYNSSLENTLRSYVPFKDEIVNIPNDFSFDYDTFLSDNSLTGNRTYDLGNTWNFYTYVPMIIEETTTNNKKIVFASMVVRAVWYTNFVQLTLINNTKNFDEEPNSLGEGFLDNVDFMRKTTLDYSDELWEQFNNGPIASSEIYNDIMSIGKYINQRISDGTRNVPEETLDDYAVSLPVFNFRKEDNSNKNINEENKASIVDIITNPKTWNNGVTLLFISMIVVIGSSVFIIKKKV